MEYYINVAFRDNKKNYYFKTEDETLKEGDYVVVETVVGLELGKITSELKPLDNLKFHLEIKPILRKATKIDIQNKRDNELLEKEAIKVFNRYVSQLDLQMTLVSTEYTLDKVKVLFTYLANDRVDFRELLKLLAASLHCRIELKQISAREKAQKIGGIGVCGLPLCCSTFFTSFEGVSLNKAKNQMLAINIPKLSGQCGKLMCCLKYEDDLYTQAKVYYPPVGTKIKYNGIEYKVGGFNILSRVIKLESADSVEYIPLKDYNKIVKKK